MKLVSWHFTDDSKCVDFMASVKVSGIELLKFVQLLEAQLLSNDILHLIWTLIFSLRVNG